MNNENKIKYNSSVNKLLENGYSYNGKGFDVNGSDLMFRKKMNLYSKLRTKNFLRKLR